jgi:hypothetical protein
MQVVEKRDAVDPAPPAVRRSSHMVKPSKVLRSLAAVGLPLALTACVNLPDTPPHQADLFKAAKEVIAARYPRSTASEKAGYIIAYTPVSMDGSWKTKKMISVVLTRTYIGAYEPVVYVTQLVEDASSPPSPNNPEAAAYAYSITEAKPFGVNRWVPLEHLPLEEQEIYDAILAKLQPVGI